jgi:hypothetical protein
MRPVRPGEGSWKGPIWRFCTFWCPWWGLGLEGGTKELILRPFPYLKTPPCLRPWTRVVRLFEFWKNHGLVLYGYLNFERTTGGCCMVIWILKEPWVGVVWLFEFWKNHGLVLYSYLDVERTMGWCCTVIWNLKEPWVSAISKNLWFFMKEWVKKGWS